MIPIPACNVVVAPTEGRLRHTVVPDTPVAAGEVVAILETGDGSRDLHAPVAGVVGGPLVINDQAVTAGQGVLWLSRR